MANKTDDIRSTLNGLIETLKDGEEGFRSSAEKLKNATIANEFRTFAAERATFAKQLQGQVARIGGTPETSGTASGALHRGWTNLKAALSGDSDHAILEEAESGEDSAVKNYREAMTRNFPPEIRSIIDRQFSEIKNTHNAVRSLRDEMKPARAFTGGGAG
jgi:uncharacterized protein (TIGR02284 family)